MYSFVKTVFHPTAIEHSISCHFISPDEESLIVAGANRLRIFRLNLSTSNSLQSKTKLELVIDCVLFGNIQSILSVRISQRSNSLDCLMISFFDAKLSILDWDASNNDLRTVSLHQFEEDDLKDSFKENLFRPLIRSDPLNRCSVMLFYGKRLAIFPFSSYELSTDVNKTVIDSSLPSPLHSYVVNLKEIDATLSNILDFQFLHGYGEPTLAFLYSPINTWIGIVKSRKDNVKLLAVSLNLNDQSNPVIWSVPSLPCDSFGLLSVHKPIGGVLVLGANCILHLNQGVPSYGLSLNSFTDTNTDFPMEFDDNIVISLDCSRYTYLCEPDKIVLSSKEGDIYVIHLITDDMRKMKKIHFEKTASSVLCTSICLIGSNHLFFGSRLGNSLLLKFNLNSDSLVKNIGRIDETYSGFESIPSHSSVYQSKQIAFNDDIDLEVYGSSQFTELEINIRVCSYSFAVCDSLVNISPISSIVMGQPYSLSEEFSENADPDLELVGCCGHSKNGALAILQRSIRPQLVTTSELYGLRNIWTLMSYDNEFDRYLIISLNESTMILQTGQEILELDQEQTAFITNETTIYAGSIFNNMFYIQICKENIRLLENVCCLQNISLSKFDSSVYKCSVSDPFIVVLLENHKLLLLEITSLKNIVIIDIPISPLVLSSVFSLYKDKNNYFRLQRKIFTKKYSNSPENYDRIDCLNQSENDKISESKKYHLSESIFSMKGIDSMNQEGEFLYSSYWLGIVRNNGCLEIYSLPNFEIVYLARNFSFAPKILIDCGPIESSCDNPESFEFQTTTKPEVQDFIFTSIEGSSYPYILAIINDELVVYKAFRMDDSPYKHHLLSRFKKESISILMHDKKVSALYMDNDKNAFFECSPMKHKNFNRFRQFDNVGGYSGVFVCGAYPHFIFKTNKDTLAIHPMYIDGPILSFSSFHNENCRNGFIYHNKQGLLRIALLPLYLSIDSPWPLRKVPLRCTAHFVAYHLESKTIVLALSNKMKGNILVKSTGEDTEEFETVTKRSRFIYPYQEKYFIELFSPSNWEAVPNSKFELNPFEHVTCLKSLHLRSQERANGLKIFICAGTTVLYGEDFPAKGRILIFDIIDVVPEPGKPLTKNKLKLLYDKEQMGPISAIDQVDGLLFTCIGKKIFMWSFKDTKELIGVAFIDAELYIHSAISLKNFILVADITKSIQLLQYREDQKSLSLISKDPYPLRCYSIEYITDGYQLGYLVSDSERNLHLFLYQPEEPDSLGGMRLIRHADIHIGSHINSMFRIRCKPSVSPNSTTHHIRGMAINERRHVTFYSTLDGSIGFIVPLSEKTFRRLQTLQNKLVHSCQHYAGLNPKSFRLAQISKRIHSPPQKNIIDGDLLCRYLNLGFKERNELAKQIGSSSSQIIDDLMDIERITSFF